MARVFLQPLAHPTTEKEREINDYYATDPIAVDALLQGGRAES